MNKEKYLGLAHYLEYGPVNVYKTYNFDALPSATRSVLEPQLVEVAGAAFCRQVTSEFALDVANHIRGGDLFVVINEKVEGFALIQRFAPQESIYIAGIVKYPKAPSRVIEATIKKYINEQNPKSVTVRTQNDRVVEIMVNNCGQVVAADRLAQPKDLNLLSETGLLKDKLKINPETLVIKGYFGSPMIELGERKRSSNAKVTALTDHLDYDRGDALMLIGYRRKYG